MFIALRRSIRPTQWVKNLAVSAVLQCALVTTIVWFCGCIGSAEVDGGATERWQSRDRGRIVFFSDKTERYQQSLPLCMLSLTDRHLTVLTDPDSLVTYITAKPVWEPRTGFILIWAIFRGKEGLWKLNPATGEYRFLTWGPLANLEYGRKHYRVRDSTGSILTYLSPRFHFFDGALEFGQATGTLFAMRRYDYDHGPPDHEINVDTLDMPDWVKTRARSRIHDRQGEWMDLLVYDSNGTATTITELSGSSHAGFSVSPDETKFAYRTSNISPPPPEGEGWRDFLRYFDRSTGDTVTVIPPEGFDARRPAFSPDGKWLAAVGVLPFEYSAILLARAPKFDRFEVFLEFRDENVHTLCWSPDSEWLLLRLDTRVSPLEPNELVAVELATGERVKIPRPYLIDGKPEPKIACSSGIDWIE